MIKAEEVKRNEYGFWTHSQFPNFDEGTTSGEWSYWMGENNVTHRFVWFECDADEETQDLYYELGEHEKAVNQWNPTIKDDNGFLFSLHDTEDGPIAVFLIPNKNNHHIEREQR